MANLVQVESSRLALKNMLQEREALPAQHLSGFSTTETKLFETAMEDRRLTSSNFYDVSGFSSKQAESGYTSHGSLASSGETPGRRVKLMCSFCGKILPRPSDGKLRYVGGETRVMSVNRHITCANFMLKMIEVYGQPLVLKYQLPDEELDALISVSSDEDLENMMDEYDRLDTRDGCPRLRVFLFSVAEYDATHLNDTGDRRNSERRYVEAVNGVQEAASRTPIEFMNTGVSHDLIGLNTAEPWNPSQLSGAVSVALLASAVQEEVVVSAVQSMPTAVSFSPKQILLKSPSASSIAPPSPPMPSRRPPHQQVGGYQNVALLPDGGNQESEYTSNAVTPMGSQEDLQYQSLKLQHGLSSGNNTEQWYMTEVTMPRVDSHNLVQRVDSYGRMPVVDSQGKLARMKEEQIEPPSQAADRRVDSYPDANISVVAQQQQWLQSPQATWQQQLDTVPDSYKTVDIWQHSASDSGRVQQQFVQLNPHVNSYEYRQLQQPHQQGDVFDGDMPHKSSSSATLISQTGPVPYSPHLDFKGDSRKQIASQQYVEPNHVFNRGLADEQSGVKWNNHVDQSSRPFSPLNSSSGYHEQVIAEEQLNTQVHFINPESLLQEQLSIPAQAKHEPLQVQSHHIDVPLRPEVTIYSDFVPYQDEVAVLQDQQEVREGQFYFPGHQIFSIPHSSSRVEFQEQQSAVYPRHHNRQNEMDWGLQQKNIDFDEARGHIGAWTQMGQMAPEEHEFVRQQHSVVASGAETGPASSLDLNMFKGTTTQNRNEHLDLHGSSCLQPESTFLPLDVGGQPLTPGRAIFSDSLQAACLMGKSEPDSFPTQTAGSKTLNFESVISPPFKEVSLQSMVSNAYVNLSSARRSSDEKVTGVSSGEGASQVLSFIPNKGISTSAEQMIYGADAIRFEPTVHLPLETGNETIEQKYAVLVDGDLVHSTLKQAVGKNLIDNDAAVPSYANHHTQACDVLRETSGLLLPLSVGLDSLTAKNVPSTEFDSSVTGFHTSSLFVEPVTTSSILAEPVMNLVHGCTSPSMPVGLQVGRPKRTEDTATVLVQSNASNDSLVSKTENLENRGIFPVFDSFSSHEQPDSKSNGCPQVGSHGHGDEDDKSNLEHVAESVAAAVFESTLYSTPTFSVHNWVKELEESELEERAAGDFQSEEKIAGLQLDIEREREAIFEDFNNLGITEDDNFEPKVEKPRNAATVAEAEAVAHGLQTIKNADLEELRELGSGTFGTVYHGKWRGTDVAIKRIKSSCFVGRPPERERLIADFWREACILGQLHHPNVVAFYGVVPDGPGGTLATVTEYMVNGSLKQVLHRKDRQIDRRKRLLIGMDAAFGMEYLHGKNIVHFDLKCENLLVNMRDSQRPICKVADLGLSKVKHQTMVSGGVRGTLPWMAPELLNGSSSLVSEKVDVFSFGIVMWELLTGEEPYANMHYGAIIGGIVNNTLRPPVPSWCEPPWRLLMERCWSAEPNERPCFIDIAGELRAMAASLNARGQGGQAHALG